MIFGTAGSNPAEGIGVLPLGLFNVVQLTATVTSR